MVQSCSAVGAGDAGTDAAAENVSFCGVGCDPARNRRQYLISIGVGQRKDMIGAGPEIGGMPMSSASSTQSLLERSLPAFTARQSDDGTWLLAVQLAPADQAALDATAPALHDLCCQAQHALGLTALGSRI